MRWGKSKAVRRTTRIENVCSSFPLQQRRNLRIRWDVLAPSRLSHKVMVNNTEYIPTYCKSVSKDTSKPATELVSSCSTFIIFRITNWHTFVRLSSHGQQDQFESFQFLRTEHKAIACAKNNVDSNSTFTSLQVCSRCSTVDEGDHLPWTQYTVLDARRLHTRGTHPM